LNSKRNTNNVTYSQIKRKKEIKQIKFQVFLLNILFH